MFFGGARTQRSKSFGVRLPAAGPFAGLPAPNSSTLPDLNLTANNQSVLLTAPTYANPAKYDEITMTGLNCRIQANSGAIFIWCNILRLGTLPFIMAIGDDGLDSDGGFGACGGGGGGFDSLSVGAYGGQGADSQSVIGADGENLPGSGGGGFYSPPVYGPFAWPVGGTGGAGETVTTGIFTGTGGSGGTFNELGFGNGGGGGGAVNGEYAGAGGGGGQLICVVANEIIYLNPATSAFYAYGGGGFETFNSFSGAGGGGGGGAVYVAARKKSTSSGAPNVAGGNGVYGGSNGQDGNYQFYQINPDNSTTPRARTDTWG